MEAVEEFTKVESIYVRSRHALLIKAHFPSIYTDYYLHRNEHKLEYSNDLDAMLKKLMAVFTLHMVARPWAETIAWTANLRAPRVNLFVTGGSTHENVTGRVFTQDVREPDRNFLYSQTTVPNSEPRTSTLQVDSNDPLEWIETYYTQSEQRPCRCFELDDENFVLIAAQPDCDLEWLESLTTEKAATILEDEPNKNLENRRFRFHCGCSTTKILPVIAGWKNNPNEIFGDDDSITIQCPRCAAKYDISRQMLDEA